MPRRSHHTLSCDRPWIPVVAKGPPLSVRMARGRPYSRNSRSEDGAHAVAFRGEQAVTREEVAVCWSAMVSG